MIKNTLPPNMNNASVSPRREQFESCDLHTVLDCPGGTFQGAGVMTVGPVFRKRNAEALPKSAIGLGTGMLRAWLHFAQVRE